MNVCTKCLTHKLTFRRSYEVAEFIEGYPDSPIWIVGINPAVETGWEDGRTVEQLATKFRDLALSHAYFRDFERVSPWLYSCLGKPGGVAHTDLVKCSSLSWPPPNCSGRAVAEIVSNCATFLRDQVLRHRPRMLICNGSMVCANIKTAIPSVDSIENPTFYRGLLNGLEVWVVLSGFIGRIDNYSRRRLGIEIEHLAQQIGIMPI